MLLATFALMSIACGACHQSGPIDEPDPDQNERKNMELSTKSTEFLQKGNQNFTFTFIDKVNASVKEDYMISPLSLQFLLGMILDGAQGETAEEICQVLGYGKGEKVAP